MTNLKFSEIDSMTRKSDYLALIADEKSTQITQKVFNFNASRSFTSQQSKSFIFNLQLEGIIIQKQNQNRRKNYWLRDLSFYI